MYLDPTTESRRKIPEDERAEDGRVLAIWGDGGWGQLVREGKLRTGSFDDRLVDALADIDHRVVTRTSARVGHGRALAAEPGVGGRRSPSGWRPGSGCRIDPIVTKIEERPTQRQQHNAAHQQHNVEGAFAVDGAVPDGPVLLVDDTRRLHLDDDRGGPRAQTGRRTAGLPCRPGLDVRA